MDPDEVIRALVSVGLVLTMSLGASCQGAAGSVPTKISSEPPGLQMQTQSSAAIH